MNTELNYDLLEQRRWREFLSTIPKDRKQFDVSFVDINSLKSFKTCAYELNSDRILDYTISLSVNKERLTITVTVTPKE